MLPSNQPPSQNKKADWSGSQPRATPPSCAERLRRRPLGGGRRDLPVLGLLDGGADRGEGASISTGNIGIGTTTPYSRLSVWGPDTSANTSAFVISNSASTTEFNVLDNGNATIAGSLNYNGGTSGTCLSDERVKQDINPFTDSLQEIVGLDPVTYEYNGLAGTPSDGDVRTGLIAQQVQQVAPDLVSTTSAFLNASDTAPTQLLEVNYGALPF